MNLQAAASRHSVARQQGRRNCQARPDPLRPVARVLLLALAHGEAPFQLLLVVLGPDQPLQALQGVLQAGPGLQSFCVQLQGQPVGLLAQVLLLLAHLQTPLPAMASVAPG
jgi:hypothetical protein